MRNYPSLLTALLALLVSTVAFGQNEEDALRYSMVEPLGSGRYAGMGGAFGALGGDLSSLSWNPAGVAIFRRNEIGFSLALSGQSADALYEANMSQDSKFAFHMPQIGIAGAYDKGDTDWRFVNFAIGYQKLRNFNSSFTIEGTNPNSSLLDVFLMQAQGTNFDELNDAFPFGAGLAWDTYLIDTVSAANPDSYISAIPYGGAHQRLTYETSGHMGETYLSIGANYQDRIYVGATLGFPVIRYSREILYREGEVADALDLDHFTLQEDYVTTGNGVNIKLGAIYRATQWLRLGAAWHSATALSLTDVWDTQVNSFFKAGDSYESFAQGSYDYNMRTPGRYIASAAFILGKSGIVSADYEFVDYSRAKLRPSNLFPDGYDFSAENTAIKDLYRSTHNVRVGAEWRATQELRLRAGYTFQQDPYAEQTGYHGNVITYSGGLEWRTQSWYTGLTYQQRSSAQGFYLYDPALVDEAQIDMLRSSFVLSFGLRY